MGATQSNQERSEVDIKTTKITTLEIFQHSKIGEANKNITKFFGEPRTVNNQTQNSNKQYNWELSKREPFFQSICNSDIFPDSHFSPDIFEKYVESVKVLGWEADWLPFYTIELQVKLRPSFFFDKKVEEYGISLVQISHPIRLFLESLKGTISSSNTMRPILPLITSVGATISQEQVTKLTETYNSIRSQNPVHEQVVNLSGSMKSTEKPLFPFVLESMGIIQQRSVITLGSNVILLFGYTSQVAFFGQRTIYCATFATESNLVERDPIFDFFGLSVPNGSPHELLFNGVSVLASVAALNGWLQSKELEFSDLEKSANVWRNSSKSIETTPSIEDLNKISTIGMRASSLASDLGYMKRVFSQGLEAWQNHMVYPTDEIPIVGQGPLSHLANDTSQHLDRLVNYISAIRDDVDWIIRNVSIGATISTNENIEKLSAQTAKYTKVVMVLTGVLIALSTILLLLKF